MLEPSVDKEEEREQKQYKEVIPGCAAGPPGPPGPQVRPHIRLNASHMKTAVGLLSSLIKSYMRQKV